MENNQTPKEFPETQDIRTHEDSNQIEAQPETQPETVDVDSALPDQFEPFIEDLPEERRKDFIKAIVQVQTENAVKFQTATAFRGPLPPPEMLAGYENALEGAADRILTMTETQLSGELELKKLRVNNESKSIDNESKSIENDRHIINGVNKSRITGQWLAFAFLVLISGGLLYLDYLGHPEVVKVFYVLAAIAGVLIFKNWRSENNSNKTEKKD